jgi:predicted N-formylglutamate amidohydrolase
MSDVEDRHGNEEVTPIPSESSKPLLEAGDPGPVGEQNSGARSPFLLVCDHAGRAVPASLARLGLPDSAFDLHIAWDIGALALAERLSEQLSACLIFQRYSRLVVDCNRSPGRADLAPAISDGIVIPANQGLDDAALQARIAAVHTPYHARIAAELDRRAGRGDPTLLVCVHSFTPVMAGFARPWHVGVLHGGASPASDRLLALLRAEGDLVVGDNEPYVMDATDYTAPVHGWARGLDVVELEVRQDLLADPVTAAAMAERLTRLLPLAAQEAG